jgi:hypothetical protein
VIGVRSFEDSKVDDDDEDSEFCDTFKMFEDWDFLSTER